MSFFLLITIDPLVNDPDKQQAENSEYQYNNPRVKIVTFYPAPHFQNHLRLVPEITDHGTTFHDPPVRILSRVYLDTLRSRSEEITYVRELGQRRIDLFRQYFRGSTVLTYPVTSILRLTMSGRHR